MDASWPEMFLLQSSAVGYLSISSLYAWLDLNTYHQQEFWVDSAECLCSVLKAKEVQEIILMEILPLPRLCGLCCKNSTLFP